MRLTAQVEPLASSHLSADPAEATSETRTARFLEVTDGGRTLHELCHSMCRRWPKLYPERGPLRIRKLQDAYGRDLDLAYRVQDVFTDAPARPTESVVVVFQTPKRSREDSVAPESRLRPAFKDYVAEQLLPDGESHRLEITNERRSHRSKRDLDDAVETTENEDGLRKKQRLADPKPSGTPRLQFDEGTVSGRRSTSPTTASEASDGRNGASHSSLVTARQLVTSTAPRSAAATKTDASSQSSSARPLPNDSRILVSFTGRSEQPRYTEKRGPGRPLFVDIARAIQRPAALAGREGAVVPISAARHGATAKQREYSRVLREQLDKLENPALRPSDIKKIRTKYAMTAARIDKPREDWTADERLAIPIINECIRNAERQARPRELPEREELEMRTDAARDDPAQPWPAPTWRPGESLAPTQAEPGAVEQIESDIESEADVGRAPEDAPRASDASFYSLPKLKADASNTNDRDHPKNSTEDSDADFDLGPEFDLDPNFDIDPDSFQSSAGRGSHDNRPLQPVSSPTERKSRDSAPKTKAKKSTKGVGEAARAGPGMKHASEKLGGQYHKSSDKTGKKHSTSSAVPSGSGASAPIKAKPSAPASHPRLSNVALASSSQASSPAPLRSILKSRPPQPAVVYVEEQSTPSDEDGGMSESSSDM